MTHPNPSISGKSFGRYQVQESIGKGGMAEVFKAYDTQLDRYVALKVINPQFADASAYLKRFEREAKALARLSHPHIVKVYEYGGYEELPFLVMEYLPGGTLKDRVQTAQTYQQAAALLLPIAHALDYAHHHHIIHRDVKPANILFSDSGDPLLSDFGIIKLIGAPEQSNLTGSGIIIGTSDYMPPEQWTGSTSPQTDIYALGVIFYQLITGRLPYNGGSAPERVIHQILDFLPDASKYVADLPLQVEDFIQNSLAKDPDDRFTNAKEMAAALEGLVGATKPPVARESRSSPTSHEAQMPQNQPESELLETPPETTTMDNRFGRYHILESVGDNKGTGNTWRAQDSQLERMVILRVFQQLKDTSPAILKQFEEETARISSLVHPNIVRLLDYGIEAGAPYLVTQDITSISLQGQTANPIPWHEVIDFIMPLTEALSTAHKAGLYHRNLCPANILISHSGTPVIIGFTPTILSQNGADPAHVNLYAAPERLAGESPDGRSDIYSLGSIFYEMLTGSPPYNARTAPALIYRQLTTPIPDPRIKLPELPEGVWSILQKMLHPDPNLRCQEIETLTKELEALLLKAPARIGFSHGAHRGTTWSWATPTQDQDIKQKRGFRYYLRLVLYTLILLILSILVLYLATGGKISLPPW